MSDPTREAAPQTSRSGLGSISLAILGAGAVGYAIQGLVPRFVPDQATYLEFSVFWSTLFLLGAALSGVQQEVTRATHPAPPGTPRSTIGHYTLGTLIIVGGVVGLTSPLWAGLVFPVSTVANAALLTMGAVGYAAMSVLMGLLYGIMLWPGVAALTLTDAFLRLILILGVLLVRPDPILIAVAVVAPFPIAVLTIGLVSRNHLSAFTLDVMQRQLARNTLSTVAGAAATGVLTSGFPLLIKVSSGAADTSAVAALVFVVTLTRAPLVVPALALQSYLTVHFRQRRGSLLAPMLRIVGAVIAVSAAVSAVAFFLEPLILQAIWGPDYTLDGWTCALIVLTAGATASLCVSGAAVLAANHHTVYVSGWAVAAAATVVAILLPLPLLPRVLTAMAVGPVLGLVAHAIGLAQRPGRAA